MGEIGNKLGLDELSGGAAGISKALLAEFIGKYILYFLYHSYISLPLLWFHGRSSKKNTKYTELLRFTPQTVTDA